MVKLQLTAILYIAIVLCSFDSFAQADTYIVNTNKIRSGISPTMWGVFFEDINRSADGGIYAELIKNGSFDFPDPFMGWQTQPSKRVYAKSNIFQVINQSAVNVNNPKYLQVIANSGDDGGIILANEGYGGMGIKKDVAYRLSLVYRTYNTPFRLRVTLVNSAGKAIGTVSLNLADTGMDNSNWQSVKAIIQPKDTAVKGKLIIKFEGSGKVDINGVSLFPTNTWKSREKGLRYDLVKKLYDMRPGFLRFPGGCIVEGKNIDNRYQWKNTIGPLEERRLIVNQWQDGGVGKPLPDYFQSFGLGFYEYFQLCEDLQAEPLPIINCGISCQFDAAEVIPLNQMGPYIQDALDLVEFANGDSTSTWGKKRIELGHPGPYNMKLLGVGNENWGPQYVERLQLFTQAIKSKYPYIQIIASTGYSPNEQFRYMDSVLRLIQTDIIDEHYYQSPAWFLSNAAKYDNFDRKGPKIFLGEYACHSVRIGSPDNKNTMLCAIAEAAFMTGLERNADMVTMAAYAPLFAHVQDWQWTPNLIWFDNQSSYSTPSYYVQQLFSLNKGTHVVEMLSNNLPIAGQDSCYASACIDKNSNEVIIKLVNASRREKRKTINIKGLKEGNTEALLTVLKSNDAEDINRIDLPGKIVPYDQQILINAKKLVIEMEPLSLSIIRLKGSFIHL